MSDDLKQFAETPPSVTILSDHAARGTLDEFRSPDRLDLRSRLAGICGILRHRNTECPVAIAHYGDWGSGKTSAMRWLDLQHTPKLPAAVKTAIRALVSRNGGRVIE